MPARPNSGLRDWHCCDGSALDGHTTPISFSLPEGRTYSIFAEDFTAEDGVGYSIIISLRTGSLETYVIDLETGEEIDRAVGGRYGKTDNPGRTDFLLDEIIASIEIHR